MNWKQALAALIITACLSLTGCTSSNYQYFDATYTFDKAIITLPNGEIVSGNVVSWRDYEDGDQIQVTIGKKTYLVHSSNVALIAEKDS